MRQVVLDTETTGLEPAEGHRVIEIGCVELVNRRPTGQTFHTYLQPDRQIDDAAVEVHGITTELLLDKPRFPEVLDAFLEFVKDAELLIHNAPFDVGFLNHELNRAGNGSSIDTYCAVLDTLALARRLHPGQRNSLDALCKRYEIDNTSRTLHGALLDARILADVYLAMTGGQAALSLDGHSEFETIDVASEKLDIGGLKIPVVHAGEEELNAHELRLEAIDVASDGKCVWLRTTD